MYAYTYLCMYVVHKLPRCHKIDDIPLKQMTYHCANWVIINNDKAIRHQYWTLSLSHTHTNTQLKYHQFSDSSRFRLSWDCSGQPQCTRIYIHMYDTQRCIHIVIVKVSYKNHIFSNSRTIRWSNWWDNCFCSGRSLSWMKCCLYLLCELKLWECMYLCINFVKIL